MKKGRRYGFAVTALLMRSDLRFEIPIESLVVSTDNVMPSSQLNAKYILAVLSASVGPGFQNGYHYGLMNVAHSTFEKFIIESKSTVTPYKPTDEERMSTWAITTSILPFGGMIGSCLTACWANIFGHKGGLMWNNLLMFFSISFIAIAYQAKLFEIFIMGRFFLGIHVGLSSGLCLIYLSEIAPRDLRGSTTAIYSFILTLSYCISQIFALQQYFGNPNQWLLAFAIAAIPSLVQVILLWCCPESPRYLLIDLNDEEKAREALIWFRNSDDITDEIDLMKDHCDLLDQLPKCSLKAFFTESMYRTPLLISLAMMVCQHTCGMESLMNYSTILLEHTGISTAKAALLNILMSIFCVVMTFVCVVTVDIFGRRHLFLLSLCTLALDTIFLTVMLKLMNYEVLEIYRDNSITVGIVFLGFCYGLGLGTIPSIVTVEVFHQKARPVAVTFIVSIGWFTKSVVNMTYLPMTKHLGYFIFLIYISMDLLLFLFIQLFLPETRGKSQREIIELFYDVEYTMHTKKSIF